MPPEGLSTESNFTKFPDPKAKPLTLSEWNRLMPEDTGGNPTRTLDFETICRIRDTIENGGFAPEPVTAQEVHAWLYELPKERGGEFQPADLGPALEAAEKVGVPVIRFYHHMDHNPDDKWKFHAFGNAYAVWNLSEAALVIAAVAYELAHERARESADVSILLRPFRREV
ncbi:MAG TPA: hypothetical protein VK054_04200 [Beutenbergiaceae bacterium]|nr:hypothetical protein [Beutenbergiaceae bacterium]